ncbi:zf-HC2 domain-containing protein [Actinomadura madurae]|uniref:zf-HC2 domain-containing protein n=1 Tax=Actinomadura madurae TaxID=1993 RepID=UPI0020D20EF6|nr:zf-HC2 domain-containing protein [Actinomadura madurae]MCP9967618.1 zf-HC2 domain-containing protein [Actinomadura madurae]
MNDCADVRTALGVYMLGALDPGERSQVEAHLEGCPACRDELAGMAGLPALLGRVDEAQLEQIAGPPPELLDGLLARAAERRRGWLGPLGRMAGGRARWVPLAAAACLVLVVGVLAARCCSRPGTAAPSPRRRPPRRPGRRCRASASTRRTRRPTSRGTCCCTARRGARRWSCTSPGSPRARTAGLLVIARDGRRDALGSWYVPYDEGYGEYRGSTMFPRGQLFSFEVVGLDGQPLLTIPT